jgi:hypothetical protein
VDIEISIEKKVVDAYVRQHGWDDQIDSATEGIIDNPVSQEEHFVVLLDRHIRRMAQQYETDKKIKEERDKAKETQAGFDVSVSEKKK